VINLKITKKKSSKWSLIIVAVVLVVLGIMTVNVLSEDVVITEEKLKASGMFGFSIKTNEIKNVEIIENVDIIIKLNGAGIGNTHKGLYRIREYGNAKLYINNDDINYNILITSKDNDYFILNLKNKEDTEKFYNELKILIN
jgi:hypothetical protein